MENRGLEKGEEKKSGNERNPARKMKGGAGKVAGLGGRLMLTMLNINVQQEEENPGLWFSCFILF